jgi:hypothetical protein
MKTRPLHFLFLLTLLAVWSCGDDEVTPPAAVPRVEFKNLQKQDDVLFNLELADNERNLTEYDRLLDDAFVFIFSLWDFGTGETPQQWDRNAEFLATMHMLEPAMSGDSRIVKLGLKLDYTAGDWTPEPPNQDHPDETWYKKTAGYDLSIATADGWKLRIQGLQAEFTIRWAGTEEDGKWRIVRWRDAV